MGTFLVGTAVVLLIIGAVAKIRKDKKNGAACGCGGDCSSCKHCGK